MRGRQAPEREYLVERVQTGVRIEKRLLKVLRALADYHDLTLGDLLEGIVLHAFDGKCPFGAANLKRIKELKEFYGLDLDSGASHRLVELESEGAKPKAKKRT
jgi:hypothetical protein